MIRYKVEKDQQTSKAKMNEEKNKVKMQYFNEIYCLQCTCCLFWGHLDILNKCSSLAPVNVKVDTDYYNMEAIKPKPIEGIQEQKMI